ncbi:MAG: hypothetical protein DRN96_09460 [Thermoproteota archaeon]|nr:MAG: hypothetical protein DRN96_09460 [Candidatus Korarchaeota archaeon]
MALESIANRRASGFAKVKHGGEEETIGVVYGAPIWVSGSPAVLEMHELDVELEEASARDVLAAALGELAARIPGRWFDAGSC